MKNNLFKISIFIFFISLINVRCYSMSEQDDNHEIIEKFKKLSSVENFLQTKKSIILNDETYFYFPAIGKKFLIQYSNAKEECFSKRIVIFLCESESKKTFFEIGYILFSYPNDSTKAYIDRIFVEDDYRKQGFGDFLLKEALNILVNETNCKIITDAGPLHGKLEAIKPQQALFKKNGFKIFCTKVNYDHDDSQYLSTAYLEVKRY